MGSDVNKGSEKNLKRREKNRIVLFFIFSKKSLTKTKKMMFSFSHSPFPGPMVSNPLADTSRTAGDAYARRLLRLSDDEDGKRRRGWI